MPPPGTAADLRSTTMTTSTAQASPLRVALASFIGTTVEFYDFLIYGTAAALVFPKLFFPDTSPAVGLLLSFATLVSGSSPAPLAGWCSGTTETASDANGCWCTPCS